MIFTHRDRVALQEQLLTKEEAEYYGNRHSDAYGRVGTKNRTYRPD